ncbi:hypothetical protein ON010_g13927 [Phytophthora cinnamomi]|nr:hypothetical protein ON010_g13927 [Phytophthora cinnamomi]
MILYCAAISSPAICQKDPDKASSINEPRGLVTLLETLPWRVRFVHLSTDFVYEGGLAWGESYEEDAAVLSSKLSVYGASKLRFDQFLLEREHSASLEVLVLRIANVIGPVAPLFPDRSAPKFMQWLHRQLFQPEDADAPLKLWSDEFRSYLYIHDLVSVMFNLLAVENNTPATLINLGTWSGGVFPVSNSLASTLLPAQSMMPERLLRASRSPAARFPVDTNGSSTRRDQS